MVSFVKTFLSQKYRYWLGHEKDSGRPILGIPVSNRMVDYIEYYWLTPNQYDEFVANDIAAGAFADACRRREQDELLAFRPGPDRGVPR